METIDMIELLSPAGNRERMEYAFHYGADAVYMGGAQFGLRAFADNFEEEELSSAIKYAHSFGKSIYITLNIFARNEDIEGIKDFLRFLGEASPDGVLVSDLGVFSLVKHVLPDMPIHISTQANTVNYQAANVWHQMGAKRIVLARELSLDEIKKIRDNTPPELELEAFVHGAMCISMSGRCLLSNYLTGRDANKGECVQACRWSYALVEQQRDGCYLPIEEDERGTYILNSKDLCMIQYLDKLKVAGITSFKIEGRMKTAYYAAVVTNAYRRAMDDLEQGRPFNVQLLDELAQAANREFTTGFYLGKADADSQRYHSGKCTQESEFVAVVLGYDALAKEVLLEQRNRFFVGETLEIFTPKGSIGLLKVERILDEDGTEQDAAPHPQQKVRIPCEIPLHPKDILRRRNNM